MPKFIYLFLALTLLAGCQSENSSRTKDYPPAIAEVFEAHGGLDRWRELGSMQFELYNSNTGKSDTHLIDLHSRKDLVQGENYSLGFDGNEVWVAPTLESFEGKSARFYHNLYFYFYAMPFVLADPGVQYTPKPDMTLQGKPYNVMEVSYEANVGDTPEDRYRLLLDPETKRLEWLLYTVTYFDKGAADEFKAMKYEGYETHEGLLFPTKLTSYTLTDDRLGELRYYSQIKNLKLQEAPPAPEQFLKPAQAATAPRDTPETR